MPETMLRPPGLSALSEIGDGVADLVYLRPPADSSELCLGGGNLPAAPAPGSQSLLAYRPWLVEVQRILGAGGTLYCHCGYREAAAWKVAVLDPVFGRSALVNELIWTYEPAGPAIGRWPDGHDKVLVYARQPGSSIYQRDEIDRLPYMAPGLVGREKESRGKLPTDTWWHTQARYPDGFWQRMIRATTRAGGLVVEVTAGGGAVAAMARALGRQACLVECCSLSASSAL
jgi:site-specific DNA-methyltransferase (adenine-specific)